jgi:propionyl-CoA synthetase
MTSAYPEIYQAWKNDPQTFWGKASALIDWYKPATQIFDPAQGPYGRWFADAECNTCYNMLDRHVEAGRGHVSAILYDSPVSGQKNRFTYAETLEQVMRLSAVMQDFGIQKGDRVLIYMPMVPQALFAMMACARLGAIHSVVFGGFSADELAPRIDHANPALIIASSCGLEAHKIVSY